MLLLNPATPNKTRKFFPRFGRFGTVYASTITRFGLAPVVLDALHTPIGARRRPDYAYLRCRFPPTQDVVERSSKMKKVLAVSLASLALLALICTNATAIPSTQVVWSQQPDMVRGFQFSSETKVPSIVADDFGWPALQAVGLRWWGGYWTPTSPGNYGPYADGRPSVLTPATIQSFVISIWSDAAPGGAYPYARPGSQLWSAPIPFASVAETYAGATGEGRQVYSYYADLSSQTLPQLVTGATYWLSIEAVTTSNSEQWGWHESSDHNLSPAVQYFRQSGWLQIQNNLYDNDMAFEITVIPEPAGLSALIVGLTGVGALVFRRRF